MASKIITRGSIVLIRYPFTDVSGEKVRPAIIVTPNSLLPILSDIARVFISSVIPVKPFVTDSRLEPGIPAFVKTGLRYRSVLRTYKIAVLHKSLVRRVLENLEDSLMHDMDRKLKTALGLSGRNT